MSSRAGIDQRAVERLSAQMLYSTDEAASILHVNPQTLRAALCRYGHYFGVRPFKAPNRFLLWPADAIESLLVNGKAC